MRHSPPKMENTFRLLQQNIDENQLHVFIPGRRARRSNPDLIAKGGEILGETPELFAHYLGDESEDRLDATVDTDDMTSMDLDELMADLEGDLDAM
jgi:hypothetical protein